MLHPYCFSSNGISVKSSRDVRCALLSLAYHPCLYTFLYCHPYFNHQFYSNVFYTCVLFFNVTFGYIYIYIYTYTCVCICIVFSHTYS